MTHTDTRARFRAAVVAVAPVVLLVGFLWHPYTHIPDKSTIAAAAASGTTRWGLSHLTIAVGSGFAALAFLALRSYLREAGEDRWSAIAFPFIVMGSTLFAILPGMEFSLLVVAETGGDLQAAQEVLFAWIRPTLLTSAATFAVGVLGFAKAVADSQVLRPRLTRVVVVALIVVAVSRFVPLGAVQFYVQGAAAIVALWPLAYDMWRHLARAPGQPRLMPTT
jgi:hypothetical protein